MRRRGTPPKRYGTPTVSPEPQALDPASGFKVPLKNLVRQWDNQLIDFRFVDKRNPQDFVRGVKDNMALPYARPEPPDQFVAQNIIWQSPSAIPVTIFTQANVPLLTQDGDDIISQMPQPLTDTAPEVFMTMQDGSPIMTQGVLQGADL